MTEVAAVVVKGNRRQKRRTNSWLERELAEARKDIQAAVVMLDALGIELAQKNDDLTRALNERDRARDDRDLARSEANESSRLRHLERQDFQQAEKNLRNELTQVRGDNSHLLEVNKRNFDKAARSADVSAVMASRVIAETDVGPVETVARFVETANKMGISPEVVEEMEAAFKRGFVSQVEQVIDDLVNIVVQPQPVDDELLGSSF